MPPDLDPLFEAALPPPLSPDERHARDEAELIALRATVANLLEEVRHNPHSAAMAVEAEPVVSAAPEHKNDALPQTEFVAMLAHELRNPLQSMSMASQLLAMTEPSPQTIAQAHRVLDRQITHMSRMLDDLLDASRAANGKIILQLAPVSLGDIINAAVETSHPGMAQRRQTLRLDLPDEALVVHGDLVRLAQVFANLLNNASQFTHMDGAIGVSAVRRDTAVEITVSDNGSGIAPDLQPYVFDLFTQGNRTLERSPGGLGIGLSLVRTIVRMHGGSAALFSAGAGAGSSFTISLPLGPVLPRSPPLPAARAAGAFKILIIEDNVDANEILGMLLEIEGHRVTSSFDGIDGLRLALGERFDIVVCDLGLPGMTGLEVVAAIKARYQQDAPLMIATTGYSEDAKRDLARAAGFDHYLVKPLNLSTVLDAIAGQAQ